MSFLEMLDVVNERLIRRARSRSRSTTTAARASAARAGWMINGARTARAAGDHRLPAAHAQLQGRRHDLRSSRGGRKAFPVIKDLVVDRSAFDRIIAGRRLHLGEHRRRARRQRDPGARRRTPTWRWTRRPASAAAPAWRPARTPRRCGMVAQMDAEGFGTCTNHYECEAACPKEISVEFIALSGPAAPLLPEAGCGLRSFLPGRGGIESKCEASSSDKHEHDGDAGRRDPPLDRRPGAQQPARSGGVPGRAADGAPPTSELIVVDDASTDDTSAVAKSAGARVLRLSRETRARGRGNHGAEHARGHVLLFVDADVGWLRERSAGWADLPAADRHCAVFGSYDDVPARPGFVRVHGTSSTTSSIRTVTSRGGDLLSRPGRRAAG